MAEAFDLYDRNRRPLHHAAENGAALKAGEFRLGCDAWIMNDRGDMLILPMSAGETGTAAFSPCVSGFARCEETPREACLRAVVQRTSVLLDAKCADVLCEYVSGNVIRDVWLIRCEREAAAFGAGARFVTLDELRRMQAEGSLTAVGYLPQLLGILPFMRLVPMEKES